jgi:DNA-binding NtrC family response regulator
MVQSHGDEAAPASADAAAPVLGAAMRAIHATADRMASGNISILLLGETGVGKEVLATRIHERSGRQGPFLRLNCAAVSESLVESELFGHEKGAFTGALAPKIGLLEAAARGTVLLDEIGDLPVGMQSKLLRALENQEIFRVGSVRPMSIDVRFLAATSRDLHALVAQDRFRPDLYYRLGGAVIRIPPLRATATRMARPVPRMSPDAVTLLERHAWPGNLRELRNVLERAFLLASPHDIGPEHIVLEEAPSSRMAPATSAMTPTIAPSLPASSSAGTLESELSELERQRILEALEACGGNQTRAAEMLGMRRATLVARLDVYGVKRPRRR